MPALQVTNLVVTETPGDDLAQHSNNQLDQSNQAQPGQRNQRQFAEHDQKQSQQEGKEQLDVLDHVAIVVRDIKESVLWYQSKFNCSIEYEDETWAMLSFSNVKLALVVSNQHPAHICFHRDDAEQFGTLKPHRDGTKSVYIRDPNGNAVEVMKRD